MNIFKMVPYYYVPPCPKCGSRCTGRYIRNPVVEKWYMEEKSLKNGEIIRFASREPIKNCFCVDCDFVWSDMIYPKMITRAELQDEIEARGTSEAYEEIHEINREKLRKRKNNPAMRIFHFIFG